MMLPERIIDYPADTIVALPYSETLPLKFPKKGIYFCSVDRDSEEGFTFFNFGEDFPTMTKPEEMIPPLAYLASEEEMNVLRSASKTKVALDEFWINCGGNIEKSRELIRIYYTRVLFSKPTSAAKYVLFLSILDPKQMPGQRSPFYTWPYSEGLRLDEALHDLTLMSTGLYGKDLLPQNGAPLRVVVPWKYGFKSAKGIVKIELVADQPRTLWSDAAPREYGFYSNVNPDVSPPRWSQASERRIGELTRRPTLMFNGYAEEVAHLYDGMDLAKNY